MSRNPYRPRSLPFWAQNVIALASLALIAFLLNWAMPLILEGLAK